ncbi:50S ribosome-binding GTPase [Nostocaceae cyanobacterium CENA357]|uniref:50S ribosome-binding GTPase n=1 Tax=Atlanticothrix silvestris CENA357 TaxID=1725252 RepID=A0A8J7HIW9_9CYAN|nr:GTPase [Atlanticothrix silvestris]MBH8555901.1 50S ribosome-binding GTPase [Atlanticothrix silvestris CENA357]
MKNEISQELQNIKDKLKPPSIAILGRCGAGKSSLIKAIFGLDDSQIGTGAGFPQTQYYKKYPYPDDESTPIILYDSPGYEADRTSEFLQDTTIFLKEKSLTNPDYIDEKIHLIWYLINAGSARIEYFDKSVIETVGVLGIPVIIVLSQCDRAKPKEIAALKAAINELKLPNAFKILEVSADPNDGKPFGLKELVNDSIEMIPSIYSEAFIVSQTVNIKAKKKVAWKMVAAAATACFGSAYVPIPGSSPASVLISQTGLLAAISEVYNLRKYMDVKASLATFTTSTLLAVIGTSIIDFVSTALVVIFPPLFIAIETISATVAASYIVVVGLALISTFEKMSINYIQSKDNIEGIKDFFEKSFKENMKQFSSINIKKQSDINDIKNKYIDQEV